MAFLDDSSTSAKTITLENGAAEAVGVAKFGTSSLALRAGTGNAASIPNSPDWQFGAGAFTVELQVQFASVQTTCAFIGQYHGVSANNPAWLLSLQSGYLTFTFFDDGDNVASAYASTSFTPVVGRWYHIVIDRADDHYMRLYINGVLYGSTYCAYTLRTSALPVKIGTITANEAAWTLDGYVDEVRVTKGVSRYPAAFSPPTVPFGNSTATDPSFASVVLLSHFDGFGTALTMPTPSIFCPNPGPFFGGVTLTRPMPVLFTPDAGANALLTRPMLVLAATGFATVPAATRLTRPMLVLAATGFVAAPVTTLLTRPMPVLAATGFVAAPVTTLLTRPMLVLAATGFVAAPAIARLTWPQPTLTATGTTTTTGTVRLTLPTRSLSLAIGVTTAIGLTQPTPILKVAGTAGFMAAFAANQPAPSLVVTGRTGVFVSAAFALPMYSLVSYGTQRTTLALPAPVLTAAATTGAIGTVALALPRCSLAAVGQVQYRGAIALLAPSMRLAITGACGTPGTVALGLRALVLASAGTSGTVGVASMVLPLVALSVAGFEQGIGTVTLSLPIALLSASGTLPAGATFSTIVMHTESMALSTYANFPFNSFAQFGGVILGACDGGIFALAGDTDNGAVIDAAARLGFNDFSTSHAKRIERAYVGYSTDGDLVLRATTGEGVTHEYPLAATRAGLHGDRVQIGKGVTARYWQFEIANVDGANFSLDALEIKAAVMARRVGGGNG